MAPSKTPTSAVARQPRRHLHRQPTHRQTNPIPIPRIAVRSNSSPPRACQNCAGISSQTTPGSGKTSHRHRLCRSPRICSKTSRKISRTLPKTHGRKNKLRTSIPWRRRRPRFPSVSIFLGCRRHILRTQERRGLLENHVPMGFCPLHQRLRRVSSVYDGIDERGQSADFSKNRQRRRRHRQSFGPRASLPAGRLEPRCRYHQNLANKTRRSLSASPPKKQADQPPPLSRIVPFPIHGFLQLYPRTSKNLPTIFQKTALFPIRLFAVRPSPPLLSQRFLPLESFETNTMKLGILARRASFSKNCFIG